jgi:acyl-CoA reductase-like NAD-dependent aldehyde dehydrogenase
VTVRTTAKTVMTAMTIGGRGVAGRSRTAVENPATGEPFAAAPDCSPQELADAVGAAAAAYPDWARLPVAQRRTALLSCGATLARHADEVADLLTREQGKPLRNARAEVVLAADWFRHTAELVAGPQRLVEDELAEITLHRMPHGVVAAIAPSNFPIILAVTKIAPALLAGNAVVVKPAPLTPLATLRMGEILAPLLPPGVLNVVSGGAELGPALVEHPDVKLVSFTGSVATGRAVAASAAARFKRVVLELGGNDACIVLPDADLGRIAGAVFQRAMDNSGQFCAAIKRVYVPRGRQQEMVDRLAELAERVTVGDGMDPATDLGPLVSRTQLDRVASIVDAAARAGGRLVTGGAPLARPGHFYPPTIVTDLPPDTELESGEQFGPVIPVLGYEGVAAAVQRANATEFGLGGSVWGDEETARATAESLDCGTVWVNTHGDLRHNVPFGGVRSSGVGVEYGLLGLLEYTRIKVVNVAAPAHSIPAEKGSKK